MMRSARLPRRLAVNRRPGNYYVTVRDGARTGWLVGPFRYHRQARRWQRAAKHAAQRHDLWSAFYAFGTARVAGGARLPVAVLNAELGITPAAPHA